MKLTTLGDLIKEIGDYDETRPIFIDGAAPITARSACVIVFGDHPCVGDYAIIPDMAKERGMTRFLTSGQLMDVEGALSYVTNSYSENELIQAVSTFFARQMESVSAV